MVLEFEWRIPWPPEWDTSKRNAAADRLLLYMHTGTFYETSRRMQLTKADKSGPDHDPFLRMTMEV